jgi:hypothetical protein
MQIRFALTISRRAFTSIWNGKPLGARSCACGALVAQGHGLRGLDRRMAAALTVQGISNRPARMSEQRVRAAWQRRGGGTPASWTPKSHTIVKILAGRLCKGVVKSHVMCANNAKMDKAAEVSTGPMTQQKRWRRNTGGRRVERIGGRMHAQERDGKHPDTSWSSLEFWGHRATGWALRSAAKRRVVTLALDAIQHDKATPHKHLKVKNDVNMTRIMNSALSARAARCRRARAARVAAVPARLALLDVNIDQARAAKMGGAQSGMQSYDL